MPRGLASSTFMKPFVVLALPGMYLFYKYNQYREQQQEQNRRKVTERELAHLNHKIDKLLTKLEENEPELATSQEDECVICVNAKATMQTSPCGHRVVCRKCFVKTIQMAVSQRLLPLRCVICRAKILRLKQSGGGGGVLLPHCNTKGWGLQSSASNYTVGNSKWLLPGSTSSYSMGKNWVPSSASQYSMANDGNVPNSESLYSMSSGSSSFSGVSSVSSATTSSQGSSSSKMGKSSGARLGYPRQPTGCLKKSQTQAMKLRIQDYKEPMRAPSILKEPCEKPARLPPIAEFQREYRASKDRTGSASTRIRCAQKIVTQLETTPLLKPPSSSPTPCSSYFRSPLKPPSSSPTPCSSYFRSPLKPANQDDKRKGERLRDVITVVKNERDENIDNKKIEAILNNKKTEREVKVEKKEEKKDAKTEKKESKAEKEERKKEAKAEKKLLKLEAKAEKKKEKEKAKEAKEAAKAAEKRDKT